MASLETVSLDQLRENFALFDDWEDRYQYLIDLGRALPGLSEDERRAELKVEGCTSQVWLKPEPGRGAPERLHFRADSDSTLVRGLIAVLTVAYDGRDRAEAERLDIEALFQDLQLDEHLTPNRRNGFFAIVAHLRRLAAALPA